MDATGYVYMVIALITWSVLFVGIIIMVRMVLQDNKRRKDERARKTAELDTLWGDPNEHARMLP